MNPLSPRGAVEALVARTSRFAGRDVCVRASTLIVRELFGDAVPADALPELLMWASWEDARVVLRLCRARGAELVVEALRWARRLPARERARLSEVYAEIDAECADSFCAYAWPNEAGTAGNVECGVTTAVAGIMAHYYGVRFEEFFAMPMARVNALCAARCDALGMQGVDTFFSREFLAEAARERESLNFDWAEKRHG